MLSSVELNKLFDRLGTPLKGRRLVEEARRNSPVREIQSRSGNVITWYNSPKMNRLTGTESRTGEFPAAVQHEHNPRVLEYYTQPCWLDLTKLSRRQHCPDILIIRDDQIIIEEWKQEKWLEKEAAKHPGRYIKETDGWHYPEVEEMLAEIGITYRLHSADEHPFQFVSNLQFLSHYFSEDCPPVDEKKIDMLRSAFAESPVMTVSELISEAGYETAAIADNSEEDVPMDNSSVLTADDIYKAITDRVIVFDLMNDDIAETHTARVYRDDIALAFYRGIESSGDVSRPCRLDASVVTGAEIEYDGITYKVAFLGENNVMLSSDSGRNEVPLDMLEELHTAGRLNIKSDVGNVATSDEPIEAISSEDMEIALKRAREVEQARLDPKAVPKSKKRTIQRWARAMRKAGGSAFDRIKALIPKTKNCGGVGKIPKKLIAAIETIAKKFNTPTNINMDMAYKEFVKACQDADLKPCSRKTFNRRLKKLASVRARKGKRAAYQDEAMVWYLKFNEPVHGVRPFQYVHIDHTRLNILLYSPRKKWKRALKRAWLSLAVDAESRRVVGFYLSFESPNYRSCMMVLRDIVRRHGRMPDFLVVDNGPEFRGREFKRVCQLYGCSIRYRPAGQPRHGSVVERLFGTAQSQLIHNLKGNTQLMQHVRTVTKSVNPENFVEWTLLALHGALDFYFEKLYGTENHPAHGEEPVSHFKTRLAETGMRLHRLVRYDRRFMVETCPQYDETGTRIVDRQRGVKVGHIRYWCDEFRTADLDGKPVEIRIDPWDVRFVYALVKDKWYKCISKLAFHLRQYTVIELRYAFEELGKKNGVRKKELSPERIAEWIKVLDPKNFDPRLSEQQSEMRLVYERFGMTTVEPLPEQSPVYSPATAFTNLPAVKSTDTPLPSGTESMPINEEEDYELF